MSDDEAHHGHDESPHSHRHDPRAPHDHDPEHALVMVHYPSARGAVRLRGTGGALSWSESLAPERVRGDDSTFRVPVPEGQAVEVKLVRSDGAWAFGHNLSLHRGDHLQLRPRFDEEKGTLLDWAEVAAGPCGTLRYRVMLPPGYGEHLEQRYPVLYAQDGQSLWADSTDPYGSWRFDERLDELWDLGAIGDFIVVGIETSERRTDVLSPTRDLEHDGGEGPAHLAAIVDRLKPLIDRTYRTRPGRASTCLLGSSMGGLFSMWAACARPDVFGHAACLSSSFWWADRWLARRVHEGLVGEVRPKLYLDCGAPLSALESDVNVRDGYLHTQSMVRALTAHGYRAGNDLLSFHFPGSRHDPESWSARLAIPLQILFPAAPR